MAEYFIRPHHMLCLQFFEGKGYSETFVANMRDIKKQLESENPMVNIIEGVDDICANCPNRMEGQCKKEESVQGHDQRVSAEVINQLGKQASWSEITEAIRTNIIDAGKIKQVCIECRWSELCFNKGMDSQS